MNNSGKIFQHPVEAYILSVNWMLAFYNLVIFVMEFQLLILSVKYGSPLNYYMI